MSSASLVQCRPYPGAQSRRVGWVLRLTDQRSRPAFASWQPLRCALCGALIPPGTIFTRHGTRANRNAHAPACCECVPYSLRKA